MSNEPIHCHRRARGQVIPQDLTELHKSGMNAEAPGMTRTALDAGVPGGGRASLRTPRKGRGAEHLCGGGWAARRSGTRGGGHRLPAGRAAWSGRRMRMITSLTCGWRGSCTGRRALVTATGNAAEGIPRGNIRGREGPACGRHPDWMQHYPAHVTCSRRTSSSRDSRQWHVWRCGATIFGGVARAGRRVELLKCVT